MYEVITLITPIDYGTRLCKAIDKHNHNKHTELIDLDIAILASLYRANKGMRNKTIMLDIRGRIFADRFYRSITRLIDLKYIVRTEYRKSVYYSITLQGRRVLVDINEHLIAIVNGR